MGLFEKIFRRITNPKIEDESLPSFWEDDYCQIEIVPRQNLENIKSTINQIDNFTENLEKLRTLSSFHFKDGERVTEKLPEYKLNLQFFLVILTFNFTNFMIFVILACHI